MSSIRKLTGQFIKNNAVESDSTLALLIEKGIILGETKILEIEMSQEVTEIWMISPDLKPDSSDPSTADVVKSGLSNGKKYIYFYPDTLCHAAVDRLKKNIGIHSSIKDNMKAISLDNTVYSNLFGRGNILLFFSDINRSIPPLCFEEIVLEGVSSRGAFWQELSEERGKEYRHLLVKETLDDSNE